MKKELARLKNFRRWFGRYVKLGYGKKCPDFAWDCAACHAHFVKDVFDDFVEDTIATEAWLTKQKRHAGHTRRKM